MPLTSSNINTFLLLKLPSAYLCGVRVDRINSTKCLVTVKHRWINQNPFRSMYFAVQAMACELSTGALVMYHIRESKLQISMLVLSNKSSFTKKATGRITFSCEDGALVDQAIQKAIETQQPQTFWMRSIGKNQEDVKVCEMDFEWTIKVRL